MMYSDSACFHEGRLFFRGGRLVGSMLPGFVLAGAIPSVVQSRVRDTARVVSIEEMFESRKCRIWNTMYIGHTVYPDIVYRRVS